VLQSSDSFVAGDNATDRSPDLGGGAEGSAPDRLFPGSVLILKSRPKIPVSSGWCGKVPFIALPPVANLVREVMGQFRRAPA